MIIGLVNQKGGVGKTTVAINLAEGVASRDNKVLLIDTDLQGSVLQWASIEKKNAFDIDHHPSPVKRSKIKSLAEQYDFIVIDAPPALGKITRSILEISNLVIVPIGPSPLDIWSSKETIALIRNSKKRNHDLECKLLVCRKIQRTRMGSEAREVMEFYKLPVFETEICQRIAYVQAMLAGISVVQYAPNSEAALEIKNLCSEII